VRTIAILLDIGRLVEILDMEDRLACTNEGAESITFVVLDTLFIDRPVKEIQTDVN